MPEIKFIESDLENLSITNSTPDLLKLVIKYFCSKNCVIEQQQEKLKLLEKIKIHIKKNGLTFNQLNELLLLIDQDIISKGFFEYFFETNSTSQSISVEQLKKGINKFRGYSLLKFGNFRFAYNHLIKKSKEEIKKELEPYSRKSSIIESEFSNRQPKMLEIQRIPRDKTWYIGYITKVVLDKDSDFSESLLKSIQERTSTYYFEESEVKKYRKYLFEMESDREIVESQALENTKVYLTWDYLDVYVATSMRNKWEFEETWDFTSQVFEAEKLKELNIRYFDPTQSKCSNPREKGLVEGLMLKRALCTIYLAQDNDTMGKDSELSATLSQGKPVIAYVPKINVDSHSKKIARYPLNYFKKRFQILINEDTIDDKTRNKIRELDENFEETIDCFLTQINSYRENQPFKLWNEKDETFKTSLEDFEKVCKILAIAEHDYYENRAKLLRDRHPLSMQINLHTGVANGVLVVRSAKECAELLHNLLLNKIEFTIKNKKEGYTVLEEDISKSQFRVIINNDHLTNAFWNLFFHS